MSLTRNEWLELLESVLRIQRIALSLKDISKRGRIITEVELMRKYIESVIGQMK